MGEDKAKQRDELFQKITVAVKEANAAEAEQVSRSKAVGLLLLEAKKLHPKVKDFDAFLNRVEGLGLSRAYDLMRLAGGRTTEEELKKDARERQAKSREKKKKKKPLAEGSGDVIELKADSFRDITGTASAEAYAALHVGNKEALACFKHACDVWLPQLGTADLAEARSHFKQGGRELCGQQ